MNREYHVWQSKNLERPMELLVFGCAGLPVLVFPTSRGRFFEFEDRGMVHTIRQKIDQGQVQLFCLDSVDAESWFAEDVPGRERIEKQLQYEKYVLDEVLPFVRNRNQAPQLGAAGCSLGGYHAANIALRHPDKFTAMLSMGGAFDVSHFLRGYYDTDCYLNMPMHYIPNLSDPWYLDKYRHNTYVLATGVHDYLWDQNEKFAALLRRKGIPVRLDVWQDGAGHDWPWWQKMFAAYI